MLSRPTADFRKGLIMMLPSSPLLLWAWFKSKRSPMSDSFKHWPSHKEHNIISGRPDQENNNIMTYK